MLPYANTSLGGKVPMKKKGATCKLCGKPIRTEIEADGGYRVVCGEGCAVDGTYFITLESALGFLAMWKKKGET